MTQQTLFNTGTRCKVTVNNGALALKTPYDPALVAAIKALPGNERRYDPTEKTWLLDPKHAAKIEGWVKVYFGETLVIPALTQVKPTQTMRLLEVHYVGACKDRDGQSEAYGCDAQTNWIYVFPEQVLRGWFDGTEENTTPSPEKTLYAILGVPRGAVADDIRAGYRRMAMQWHPDRCKEPNAHEVFLRIQEAYAILNDGNKRARYDAGLALEATLGKQPTPVNYMTMAAYRAPLRCGQIMAEGIESMGRFKVSKILVWQDVFNQYGQTLVSSWPMGAKEPVKVWA
jgi:hypothetical protein